MEGDNRTLGIRIRGSRSEASEQVRPRHGR